MARKKRGKRKAATSRKRSTTRRKKSASVRARSSNAPKRANPAPKRRKKSVTRSKSRKVARRRSNPLISGNVAEAGKLVGATIAINFVNANFVAPVAARFIPGQFAQPVSLWATGQGLGWLAGMTSFTRPFSSALKLMGWVLGIGALVTPIVSGFLNRGRQQVNGGNGMRGIAAVSGIPPQITAPPPRPGMQGVAALRTGYAR